MTQLALTIINYLLEVLTEIRAVRIEIQEVRQRLKHTEDRNMSLQDDLNKLQSDIAAYKQKQADAQAAEDTLEQGQASTLADLTTRVTSLETTGSPQIAELASQLQQVVGIVNQLVAQAPEVTTPVEPPTPPSENLSTGSRRRG